MFSGDVSIGLVTTVVGSALGRDGSELEVV